MARTKKYVKSNRKSRNQRRMRKRVSRKIRRGGALNEEYTKWKDITINEIVSWFDNPSNNQSQNGLWELRLFDKNNNKEIEFYGTIKDIKNEYNKRIFVFSKSLGFTKPLSEEELKKLEDPVKQYVFQIRVNRLVRTANAVVSSGDKISNILASTPNKISNVYSNAKNWFSSPPPQQTSTMSMPF